jgi:YHS domain-containing protein
MNMGTVISILLFVAFFYLMMKFGCGAHVHGGGCGHGGHHREKTGERTPENITSENTTPALKTVTRDPVCGMDIEVGRAFRSLEYGSKTYYFCSKDCLAKFRRQPEYFAEIERMESRYIA